MNQTENIMLFNNILQSEAVKEFYASKIKSVIGINEYYKQIVFLTREDSCDKIKKVKETINQTVIVLPLTKGIKAITTGFLRIAVNSK